MEWTPLVDILNAVAEERGGSKRFFAYEADWGNCDRLVIYVEPETAKELAGKFSVVPVSGGELYFGNKRGHRE